MGLIRVRVEVLPWSDPKESPRDEAKARQETIRPWLEPCAEEITINKLAKKVVNRFKNTHGGALDIKYLTDYWGDELDASDTNEDALRVGHVFKETENISDRTVKVVQSPPNPYEQYNSYRYGSILPESSARPRKRLLDQFLPGSRSSPRDVAYDGGWESAPFNSNETSNKRQKTHARQFNEMNADRVIRSREGFDEGLYISSQSSVRRGSPVHQVDDSQRSPRNKHPNPYGTPTSLTVNSPLKLATARDRPFSIPDSPPSRAASFHNDSSFRTDDIDLRNTKSESPELSSIFELPFDDIAAITEGESVSKMSTTNGKIATPASLLQSNERRNQGVGPVESRAHLSATIFAVPDKLINEKPSQFVKPGLPFSRTPSAKAHRNVNGSRAQSLDTFDPINTDMESSQELQHLPSAKRPHSDNALPGEAPPSRSYAVQEQKGGNIPFIVPPLRKPTSNIAVSLSLDGNIDPQSGAKTQLQAQLPKVVQPSYEQDFSPNADRQAPVRVTEQDMDEQLPWEIQAEEQLAGEAVQHIAKQQETETIRGHRSTEAMQRGRNRVERENERRAEEAKAAQELAAKEATFAAEQARQADLVAEEAAKKALVEDNKAKAKLARDLKAKEEEESRKTLADQKENAEKDLAEKLAQEEKANKEEARKNQLAQKKKEEQLEKRSARRRELAAQKRASDAKFASDKASEKPKQEDTTKTREEKKARVDPESLAKVNTKDPEQSSEVTVGDKRKSTSPSWDVKPIKTPRLGESSDTRSRKSSTPSSMRSDPDRVRSSMTPAIPSTANKLSSSGKSSVTVRLSAQTPLRSAFQQKPSGSRRSVSFVDEPSDPTKLDSYPSTAATLKMNGAKSILSRTEAPKGEIKSRSSSISESSESVSRETTKQSKDLLKKPIPKEKVQTILNIKRDKKMKGRVIDPPRKITNPAPQENIIISSGSEASFSMVSEDEEDRPRNAKAGPSSKKKPTIAEAKPTANGKAFPTSNTSADTIWESFSQDAETPSRKVIPQVVVEAPLRTKSRSRSPAQYIPGANSVSSGSDSGSGSESESVSGSGSGSGTDSGSESGSEDELDTLSPVKLEKHKTKSPESKSAGSRDIEMKDTASVRASSTEMATQSSRTSSVGVQESVKSKDDDCGRLAQDADQQLQRECRQSLNPSSQNKSSKTLDPPGPKAKLSTPATNLRDPDHPVRQRGKSSNNLKRETSKENSSAAPKPILKVDALPGSALRPSNQRYPSIKELTRTPEAGVKPQTSGLKSAGSRGMTISVADGSLSSSSESESESESSDGGITTNNTSQNSATSKNKATSLKGVLKLARISRARGSQQR